MRDCIVACIMSVDFFFFSVLAVVSVLCKKRYMRIKKVNKCFFSECVYCTLLCVVLRTLFPLLIGAIWKEAGETVKEMDFLYILFFSATTPTLRVC